ncbi:hypothetical protein [Actinoplanes sp. NPDC049599]|uniref:hypothetical protein n=1 Tax=Actinoplanes sp. NPDC049599 TaxID=3363903 RepID=UPI0037B52C37
MTRPAEPTGDPAHEHWALLLTGMRAAGARAGADAADWWAQDTIGGRATGDTTAVARRIVERIDAGDPQIGDRLPTFAGSGASGDVPGEADLIYEIGADRQRWTPSTSARWDQLVAAYAMSFDQAVLDRAGQLCRDVLEPDDEPDSDDGVALSVGDPDTMRTRLLARMCDTCIFRPGNLMHLHPGRLHDLIAQARDGDGFIVCHSTLPGMAPDGTDPAVCRGFADRYDTQALQIIGRLFGFDEIEPPNVHHG